MEREKYIFICNNKREVDVLLGILKKREFAFSPLVTVEYWMEYSDDTGFLVDMGDKSVATVYYPDLVENDGYKVVSCNELYDEPEADGVWKFLPRKQFDGSSVKLLECVYEVVDTLERKHGIDKVQQFMKDLENNQVAVTTLVKRMLQEERQCVRA